MTSSSLLRPHLFLDCLPFGVWVKKINFLGGGGREEKKLGVDIFYWGGDKKKMCGGWKKFWWDVEFVFIKVYISNLF